MLANSDKCYLSPELMHSLAEKDLEPSCNKYKADVYTLGITLLYATTLVDPVYCYDYPGKKILKHNVDELLLKTGQMYSAFLTDTIRKMLSEKEGNRPSFRDLYGILLPYQSNIRNMRPFEPQVRYIYFLEINNILNYSYN